MNLETVEHMFKGSDDDFELAITIITDHIWRLSALAVSCEAPWWSKLEITRFMTYVSHQLSDLWLTEGRLPGPYYARYRRIIALKSLINIT